MADFLTLVRALTHHLPDLPQGTQCAWHPAILHSRVITFVIAHANGEQGQ
ncbi:hypothetical protein PT7_2243 [Pusillimonas sp. T7-7]|nr:hypothetical protein [Pusillimonas sp. T7-7]AEC20783.1 hypothetical protein PT7_2243 [Pusillimonas sp. T7-7]